MTALLRSHNNRDTDNEIRVFEIPRQPYVNRDINRENYISSILYCGDTDCLNQIRIRLGPFSKLCEMLERRALLVNTMHMSRREQGLMFLRLLCHNVWFRAIGGTSGYDIKEVQSQMWDENMRKICMSLDVYSTYIKANPTHEKHLNKKIDMYDKITIVVRKDVARGSGAKLFDDVEIQ
ncbi:hypothetical protein Cgig2_015518 [Carnegiea gigantea]|uniref:DUF8040 domain-containing protein n=1 Tax=Carnegiea gigantea TaxID=171969 RepID=A0A9Q1Q6K6_9CARY|nr:hypothetical protein Cgig2_015518 [Carnegiea gigantea]